MLNYIVTVTVNEDSEWNATDAGVFRDCGHFSFAGQEYDDHGHMIGTYDVEVHEEEDIEVIKSRLSDEREVISFEIE